MDLKRILSGRYFATPEEPDGAINAIISSGEMKPVKLMPCLIP